jgi:hypothetical protein
VRRSRNDDCEHRSVRADAENVLRLAFVECRRDRAAALRFFADPDSRSFAAAARRLAAEPLQIAIYKARELAIPDLRAS